MSLPHLEALRRRLSAQPAALPTLGWTPAESAAIEQAVAYLHSPEALAQLAADPYWPKWDGAWWHMELLWELGLAAQVPQTAVHALVASIHCHLLPSFPFRPEDIPASYDHLRGTPCHCQLGTVYQVLSACGFAVDVELPWIRSWFLRYQLPDGGVNCDEAVYLRPHPHSSVVSTLPALEALLCAGPLPLAPAEEAFLARGAAYLSKRQLFRSLSRGGVPIDTQWLTPTFPRFYEYDVLRGLAFLVRWALPRPEVTLAAGDIAEAVCALPPSGEPLTNRAAWRGVGTRRQTAQGEWIKQPAAATFALLTVVGSERGASSVLARVLEATLGGLGELDAQGRLRWE